LGRKIILLLVVSLFLVTLVSAVPPTATTEGWIVRSAIPDIFQKQTGMYDFHVHVFDATTGNYILEDASCYIHIYDSDGTHLYEGYDETVSHNFDYSFKVDEGNFTIGIEYPYIVQCNGTYATDDEAGFYSASFRTTYNGLEISQGEAIIYAILLIMFLFLFILIFLGINMLPASNTTNPEGEIISISYLKYLRPVFMFTEWMLIVAALYISSNLAFAYLEEQLVAKFFFALFQISLAITPIILVVWVIGLFLMFYHDKEFQNLINRGFYPKSL